ncbi:transcriptional regulator [Mangrovactinospora gilvigrisea]|uniref:Transcriptional regulator n=1 Tax=Mangrovactinospora gilvigrisea TaxID=1428644 RepID=A0A1J7CDG1_9ACTN|nr:helix-turn-helix domain-containing protein [Mangrovactinospora gilvigrisea]OIV37698.1 transcriptional regulator [Mangrovactinospora gilvigrisea]
MSHPLEKAIAPLLEATGAEAVPLAEAEDGVDDVLVLHWEGEPAVAVRLPHLGDLPVRLLAEQRRRHGPLDELDRHAKQLVVAALEERGAFQIRHGVEKVAAALGVSRFTIYNYLNREQASRQDAD